MIMSLSIHPKVWYPISSFNLLYPCITIDSYEMMEMNSRYIFLKKHNGHQVNDEGEDEDAVLEIDHESA